MRTIPPTRGAYAGPRFLAALIFFAGISLGFADTHKFEVNSLKRRAEEIAQKRIDRPHVLLRELHRTFSQELVGKALSAETIAELEEQALPPLLGNAREGGVYWVEIFEGKEKNIGGSNLRTGIRITTGLLNRKVLKVDAGFYSTEKPNLHLKKEGGPQDMMQPVWCGALRLRRMDQMVADLGRPTQVAVTYGDLTPVSSTGTDVGFEINLQFGVRSEQSIKPGALITLRALSGLDAQNGILKTKAGKDTILTLPNDHNCCSQVGVSADPFCKYFEWRHEMRW